MIQKRYFSRIQHPSVGEKKEKGNNNNKTLSKLGTEGDLHQCDTEHLQKPTANIPFNGENGLPPKFRNKAEVFTLIIPLHNHIGNPCYCSKTRKGNKNIQIGGKKQSSQFTRLPI